jgi:hypothetical protein
MSYAVAEVAAGLRQMYQRLAKERDLANQYRDTLADAAADATEAFEAAKEAAEDLDNALHALGYYSVEPLSDEERNANAEGYQDRR